MRFPSPVLGEGIKRGRVLVAHSVIPVRRESLREMIVSGNPYSGCPIETFAHDKRSRLDSTHSVSKILLIKSFLSPCPKIWGKITMNVLPNSHCDPDLSGEAISLPKFTQDARLLRRFVPRNDCIIHSATRSL